MKHVPITNNVVSSNPTQTAGRWFSPGIPVSSTNKTDLVYRLSRVLCTKLDIYVLQAVTRSANWFKYIRWHYYLVNVNQCQWWNKYSKNSFRFAASTLWNSLPDHFRTENSFSQFKSLLQFCNGSKCRCSACRWLKFCFWFAYILLFVIFLIIIFF